MREGRLVEFEISRNGLEVRVRVSVEARVVPVDRDGRCDVRCHHVPHPTGLVQPGHQVEARRLDVGHRPARGILSNQRGRRVVQGDDVEYGEDRDVVVYRLPRRRVFRRVRNHRVDVVRSLRR